MTKLNPVRNLATAVAQMAGRLLRRVRFALTPAVDVTVRRRPSPARRLPRRAMSSLSTPVPALKRLLLVSQSSSSLRP